jgi:hypothetical protein
MNLNKTVKGFLVFFGFLLLLLLFCNKQLAISIFGLSGYRKVNLDAGNIDVPHERNIVWKSHSAFADSVFKMWADKPVSDKMLEGKGNVPRIILAKLFTRQDIGEANRILMKHIPWGVSGSSWALNKKGDYDFTLTVFTTILWLFGDNPEILYPETKDYLLNVLITEDGNKFRYTAPRTLNLVKETENHILMTEGSRYLKNRWIMLHGSTDSSYDNIQNGMERKILTFMEQLRSDGLYEFNSLPYIGYTITALLNLEAFASEKVRIEARNVLDYLNWCYALGSYQLKHYPPMRRRYEKAGIQELTTDYHSIFMKAWLSYSPLTEYNKDIRSGEVHALMGVCMPYRPADRVIDLIFNKGYGYFIKMGHGPAACPEIYSAGKHFLLSAGGVNRGKSSIIVPRAISLFFNDTADILSESIHLSGPGSDFMKWNNTGVYKNFACAAGPVFVPAEIIPFEENKNWSVFSMRDSISVAIYSTDDLGLIAIFENHSPEGLLNKLLNANPDEDKLKDHFQFPVGRIIRYDVNAPENKWVIVSDNQQIFNREFDLWSLIEGEIFQGGKGNNMK